MRLDDHDGELLSDAMALQSEMSLFRRQLHQWPEIGLNLPRTQAAILRALEGMDLDIRIGTALTSVTAVLRGARPGPAVLLRADMDALPIEEGTLSDYGSLVPGVMHACGHDLHVSALLGAAKLLYARRHELSGSVVLMFQPGEEACDGAGLMVEEGVLTAAGTTVVAAYGLHVHSDRLPPGTFGTKAGTLMAASDDFDVRVVGAGGHGGTPWKAADPIPVAAEMILALQAVITRSVPLTDPAVLTVGTLHAGTARNVISEVAEFSGTIRMVSESTRTKLCARVRHLCESVADAHGLRAEVTMTAGYPATVNDGDSALVVEQVVSRMFGPSRFRRLEQPVYGSEDFSRILSEVPGCFVFFGAGYEEDPESAPPNHSAIVSFDDSLLPAGSALLTALALSHLR